MEVLQFPARQSSASPAKEGWVRGELSGVMTLAFEAIADSISVAAAGRRRGSL